MNILLLLKSILAQPTFQAGERVNQLHRGSMLRTDGFVVGQTARGVLVEWPRGGATLVNPAELAVIG